MIAAWRGLWMTGDVTQLCRWPVDKLERGSQPGAVSSTSSSRH